MCDFNLSDVDISNNFFLIEKNEFLKENIIGYFHQYYTGYNRPGNPQAVNILKNTYNNKSEEELLNAARSILNVMVDDVSKIIEIHNMENCVLLVVPRAKRLDFYQEGQLLFRYIVEVTANRLNLINGVDYIVRVKDTRTTHLKKHDLNGDLPYIGITNDTCVFKSEFIKGKSVILIDDIYTKTVNVDEDCLQSILDLGAKKVIFYCIGYTKRNS